ncbi:glycoprotein endo-alpha-1,2-mannosidase-like protein [Drosophila guanche]|uniref:Blast:Glycoprotein endo-alpha-1,2-mannosidase n=1 Tax=Drosophila guanche TaxID=7266 RepID=A0A3B0JP81_DROGU|nr:glycoprotein endo-alpha-1,2-mannosidase-like protein [Drosophila guanche]SPP82172.1 blast:Glycoprotein endo-alpha-1%2C2-mannosidase [Drosophila guanche]
MLLKKYVKTRRKVKIVLLLAIVGLLVITIIVLGSTGRNAAIELLLDERFIARAYRPGDNQQPQTLQGQKPQPAVAAAVALLQPQRENGVIVPEKYNEHKIKARIIQNRLDQIKQQQQHDHEAEQSRTTLEVATTAVHIFYTAPVPWYKSKKPPPPPAEHPYDVPLTTTPKAVRILNTAFYPALGLYKPSVSLLSQHFENIRSCGIGVLILSFTGSGSGKPTETALLHQIIELAPQHNLTVTFEVSVAGNQSVEYVRQHLQEIATFASLPGFYRVWSQSRGAAMPVLYVSNAYKLSDSLGRLLCRTPGQVEPDGLRRVLDGFFIGHIRLKSHADVMRRLCFDGFYSKLPSNGAVFASTWKNWSYLKSFAQSYKMMFVPTVGPGFAERNKFPRHGDIQRHRSNGRYYGVAWRSAILNHVGFINIASYNNWPDGSQIEEVMPRAGFLDYNPGSRTKYLDLTAHWVGNFLKTRQEAAAAAAPGSPQNCYELLNGTIC